MIPTLDDVAERPDLAAHLSRPAVQTMLWNRARAAAGYPDKLFHDLRRTAARDLVEAGEDYKTAMEVTGHKTLSVFMRYQIVDSRATARALRKVQAHRAGKPDTLTDNGG